MELREPMAKHRPLLLILVCLALAALVWMDNRGALFSGKNRIFDIGSHHGDASGRPETFRR